MKGGKPMDEQQNIQRRQDNPRRKRRTHTEIFKEAYLPSLIACAAIVLIISVGCKKCKYNDSHLEIAVFLRKIKIPFLCLLRIKF